MRRIFELRFQVYCKECGYLPPANYPEGLEVDEYDADAVHFCAFNSMDELVGYVRLVRPAESGVFPFQMHCPDLLEGVTLPEPSKSVEISRLMVREDYRRRRGDMLSGVNTNSDGAAAEMNGAWAAAATFDRRSSSAMSCGWRPK